jgi:hypothetical protein
MHICREGANMRKFENFGPFKIPREGRLVSEDLKQFWQDIEGRHEGLSGAKGCYVFGVKPSGTPRITPWYVGQTNGQSFVHECFRDHKIKHYNHALHKYKKNGVPYLYLVASMKPKGGFSTQNIVKTIGKLEEHLISLGLLRNLELRNTSSTKFYKETEVPGLLNKKAGKSKANQTLRSLFVTKVANVKRRRSQTR